MVTQILMPALSPTMEDGKLSKWFVSEGDSVNPGDLLAEIETDKATMEFEAIQEGTIAKILVKDGTSGVKVNAPIAEMETDDEVEVSNTEKSSIIEMKVEKPPKESTRPLKKIEIVKNDSNRVFASPIAKRIAKENDISLNAISGSGPKGRIIKKDIEKYLQKPKETKVVPASITHAESMSFDQISQMYQDRNHQVVELEGMRSTIAKRLSESKQTIPHFYLRREVSIDALLELRSKVNAYLSDSGRKVSINDFIILAVAKALQTVPEANAVWASGKIIQLSSSDVAVAVAIDGGLVTPVIKDADKRSLTENSAIMKDLAKRAREKKLSPMEYIGGSITVSNLGMYGIENFDAIINPPHASILAVGTGIKKAVVNSNGELGIETKLSLTLSVDHRVVDGALGANFLAEIVSRLQNPVGLVID